MCGQYSPRVFLLFAIGSTLYSALAYYSFAVAIQQGAFQSTAFIVATVSVALRTFSLVLMWLIWCVKPGGIEAPVQWLTNRFFHCLPTMQAIFPVAIGLALALRIATTILVGDCSGQYETARIDGFCDPYYDHGGISLRLTVELIFNPILVAFLLRDTPIVAIVLSWALAVAVLVACSVVLDSADIAVATAGYVFCSVLIFFECSRQHQERERVLDELQRTVEENERLAKQEQAKELRAMMGNMAHDLKTVSKLCCDNNRRFYAQFIQK
jgi:signal transduction histidine kinase